MKIIQIAMFLIVINFSCGMILVSGAFPPNFQTEKGEQVADYKTKAGILGSAEELETAAPKSTGWLAGIAEAIKGAAVGIGRLIGMIITVPTAFADFVGMAIPDGATGATPVESQFIIGLKALMWFVYGVTIYSLVFQFKVGE